MYRCDHRDDGFPRSDISLEKASHRMWFLHIFEDLEEDDFLLIGEREGEICNEGFDEIRVEWCGGGESLRARHHRVFLLDSNHLEVEEFLIAEFGSSSFKIFDTLRKMDIANIRSTW
jgi:hypothetical protein